MTDAINMQLSAFVDGELSDAESELLIRRIGRDPELRATVAEYHAIGRVMRAEGEPAGMEDLLAAVRAGIEADDSPVDVAPEVASSSSLWRPLTGFAVAASVALVGVIGVSQFSPAVAPADPASAYTTPSPEVLEFYHRHIQSTDEFYPIDEVFDVNNPSSIYVTQPLGQRDVEAPADDEAAEDGDESDNVEE